MYLAFLDLDKVLSELLLFFLWFPCVGEMLVYWSLRRNYFRNLPPLVSVVGFFSPLFFLLCLSQISLHEYHGKTVKPNG